MVLLQRGKRDFTRWFLRVNSRLGAASARRRPAPTRNGFVMQRDKIVVTLHLVWTTRDRLPLIAPEWERALHDCLGAVAVKHGCRVIAINGMEDHVHLLLAPPPTVSISFLVQQLKGVSSHFVNTHTPCEGAFKWRGSFAAFSVSRWDVAKIATYIRRQKEHHAAGSIVACGEPDD